MSATKTGKSWEDVSKMAYWDRAVSLDKWREKVAEGHRSYLPEAVSTMTPVEFIGFYGVERFKLDWPVLRATLTPPAAKRAGVYDIAWSRLVGGGWNLKPTEDFYRMPARRRQFLVQVARTPGKCIYEVAKSLGMQYRRAHDHAMNLVRDGKLRTMESFEGGHRQLKLFPSSRTKVVQDRSEPDKTTLVELIDEGQTQ